MSLIDELRSAIEKNERFIANTLVCREESADASISLLSFEWKVYLPSREAGNRSSSKGVGQVEPIILKVGNSLGQPFISVMLRKDFPRHCFPHINPSDPGDWVYPCLADIPNFELVLKYGAIGLLTQITSWLDKAARDELMDESQGWEPYIFDSVGGTLVLNNELHRELEILDPEIQKIGYVRLRLDITSLEGRGLDYESQYFHVRLLPEQANKGSGNNCVVITIPESAKTKEFQNFPVKNRNQLLQLVATFNQEGYFGESPIMRPETAHNENLERHLASMDADEKFALVILLVSRPFNLIGSHSNREVLPFLIRSPHTQKNSEVFPLSCVHQVDSEILAKVSGTQAEANEHVVLLGAGSVGSKIATSLARGGNFSFDIFDGDRLLSHNMARHSLLEHRQNIGFPKSFSLCNVLEQALNTECAAHLSFTSSEAFEKIEEGFLLDCTGNDKVTLQIAHSQIKVPVFQTHLYSSAKVGYLSKESESRAVRIDDIEVFFWMCVYTNSFLQRLIVDTPTTETDILTSSCSSKSNVMSDIELSYPVAAISYKINEWVKAKALFEERGLLSLCIVDSVSLAMSWFEKEIMPTEVFHIDESTKEIRLNGNLASELKDRSAAALPSEAGGCLLGRVCPVTQNIYICGAESPPDDEVTRSQTKFEFSTDWLRSVDETVRNRTASEIYVVGTWHSHTTDAGPSKIDQETRKQLESDIGLSVVAMLLVRAGRIDVI